MAETHLIDVTGRTVFRGTQKPPGGGSQPGIACADFLFTEGDTAGTYTARLPLPAGTTVLDVLFYNFALWEAAFAGTALLTAGDTVNGAEQYFNSLAWGGLYDATAAPDPSTNGTFTLTDGGTLRVAAYGQTPTTSPVPGAGVFYAADDEFVAVIVTTLPAEPDPGNGRSLLRVLYLPPQTPTPAVFT